MAASGGPLMDLLIPPSMSFWKALQAGLVEPLEDPRYIAWLHTRRCVISGERGKRVTAHHLVGHGLKAVGGKVSDYLAFPLVTYLHLPDYPEGLHKLGHKEWERRHGSQLEFVARTLIEAVYEGVLVLR
jgi:hypothetical protein